MGGGDHCLVHPGPQLAPCTSVTRSVLEAFGFAVLALGPEMLSGCGSCQPLGGCVGRTVPGRDAGMEVSPCLCLIRL